MKKCSIENCVKPHKSKGFCNNHYIQWRYANDPEYRQNRITTSAKRKTESLLDPVKRARHNEQNLRNMKKRYDTNEEYRSSEQNRTREFRRGKYANDGDFRKKESINAAQRKKHIKRATPKWADLKIIKEFYENRPEGYHVDHIIPLKGKNVSGLHVIENLQYLKGEENLKKSNKINVEGWQR